ncbi:MAG: carboxymuconolactone decarboxylase family protein [Pseudomonadota bacterium]
MTETAQAEGFPERLAHIRSNLGELNQAQPETMEAFARLHRSATAEGALDNKTKELIALGIAVAARCDGCIAFHAHDALRAGASAAEINDALGVAIMMGGGPSLVYATHVVDAVKQFGGDIAPALESVNPQQASCSAYLTSDHHFD